VSRKVLFDTETTGLDPKQGDRVLEFAAIELINDLPTDRTIRFLINPERDVPADSSRIHGFTNADVEGQPNFAAVADEILAFIGNDPLVAHNAPFDFGFMDAEFGRLGHRTLDRERMIDTLALAKARFPGLPNSLDALCRRFNIDLSARTTHNALLDCQLLAQVYVELTGGRQRGLSLASDGDDELTLVTYQAVGPRTPRLVQPSAAELEAHAAFLGKVKEPIWNSG
jgi:DNA polymerase III subunit epsilon